MINDTHTFLVCSTFQQRKFWKQNARGRPPFPLNWTERDNKQAYTADTESTATIFSEFTQKLDIETYSKMVKLTTNIDYKNIDKGYMGIRTNTQGDGSFVNRTLLFWKFIEYECFVNKNKQCTDTLREAHVRRHRTRDTTETKLGERDGTA